MYLLSDLQLLTTMGWIWIFMAFGHGMGSNWSSGGGSTTKPSCNTDSEYTRVSAISSTFRHSSIYTTTILHMLCSMYIYIYKRWDKIPTEYSSTVFIMDLGFRYMIQAMDESWKLILDMEVYYTFKLDFTKLKGISTTPPPPKRRWGGEGGDFPLPKSPQAYFSVYSRSPTTNLIGYDLV